MTERVDLFKDIIEGTVYRIDLHALIDRVHKDHPNWNNFKTDFKNSMGNNGDHWEMWARGGGGISVLNNSNVYFKEATADYVEFYASLWSYYNNVTFKLSRDEAALMAKETPDKDYVYIHSFDTSGNLHTKAYEKTNDEPLTAILHFYPQKLETEKLDVLYNGSNPCDTRLPCELGKLTMLSTSPNPLHFLVQALLTQNAVLDERKQRVTEMEDTINYIADIIYNCEVKELNQRFDKNETTRKTEGEKYER